MGAQAAAARAPAATTAATSAAKPAAAAAPTTAKGGPPQAGRPAYLPAQPGTRTGAQPAGKTVAPARAAAKREAAEPPPRLPILPMPRMGVILAPAVPAPPADALRHGAEILTRTGSMPEVHHARITQAVQGITEAARAAQRDVVLRIGLLARDSRHSIEGLTHEVPRLVGGAIGIVRAAVQQTRLALTKSAEAQILAIKGHREQIGDDFAAVRTTVMTDMHANLLQGSAKLRAADTKLRAAFDAHLQVAQADIAAIPQNGALSTIGLAGDAAGPPIATARPANVEQAGEDMQTALRNEAGKNALRVWQDKRCADAVPALMAQQKQGLVAAATARGAELNSGATRAEFARLSFGLIAPTAAALDTDAEGDRPRAAAAVAQQHARVHTVAEQAEATIRDKLGGTLTALDWNRDKTLPHQIEDGLHKAGQKIVKALREQARAAEHAMRGTAAGMAEAYPDVVARLRPLLPSGVLLDARVRLPRLAQARQSLDRLHAAQTAAARGRADAALQQGRDTLRAQGRSLSEMASGGARTVRDVLTPASFDFELVAALYTNPMHAGARLATNRVRHYAETQAENLLRPLNAADHGVTAVERAAVGFLNGNIRGEHEGFLRTVRGLAEDMEKEGGPLAGIRTGVEADLSARVDKLDGALKERSAAGATASTVVGLGAGAGVYVWATHSDQAEATRAIGELPWPGPPALEWMFQSKTGGSLRTRIANSSLWDSERDSLLNLMSSSAATRGGERQRLVQDSTGWLTGPSRETREALLRGMGAEERAAMPADQLAAWQANLRSNLHGTELEIAIGYTEGDPARVLAARMQERLDKAYGDDDDSTALAMDDIDRLARQELGSGTGAYVPPEAVADLTDRMFPVFQQITAPPGSPDAARPAPGHKPTPAEMTAAREHFIAYATRSRTVVVPDGPDGMNAETIVVPVDQRVQNLVRAAVEHGGQSDEAWAARAGYEVTRAEAESRDRWRGGLSESSEVRLTQHMEDPALARAVRDQERLEDEARNASPERQRQLGPRLLAARQARAEAEAAHGRRMQLLAPMLGGPATGAGASPAAAKATVAQHMGAIFASGHEEDRRYGTEIVDLGRASMDAGVRLAVRGVGTNEELLTHVTADRSHLEIGRANAAYLRDHGESMESAINDDVSGDLAMDMTIALKGEPENDLDRADIANLRHQQQRVQGTGFIAAFTMQDTWQQRELDQRRDEMGGAALDAALQQARATGDTAAIARLSAISRDAVFGPDGQMPPDVKRLAFDEDGNLRGNRVAFQAATARVGLAANSYKAEIDRQESMLTSLITAAAIAVSVLLLFVPGVNLVAAGVLTALIAGGATIAVKAGMRGGRYGWEEAATDVAMTAIEAATAGAGGAMGGGLGKVGMAGRLFAVGTKLEAAFGKLGGVIAREAVVAGMNGAAQVALQDETWRDGPGRGMARVVGGGVRGATVAAVTAGVSAGVQARLGGALAQAETTAAGRAGRALGATGRAVVTEAVTNSVAAMAGEATGILTDVAMGRHQGSLGDALGHIGTAGLRDLLSGGGRALAHSVNTARYHALLSEARAGGELSPQDLRALRLAAISAGAHVGGHEANYDLDPAALRHEVEIGRIALAGLPPGLRQHLAGADAATLMRANRMLAAGEAASPAARAAFVAEIRTLMPGVDTAALSRDLAAGHEVVHGARIEPPQPGSAAREQQRAARRILVAELDAPARGALRDLPMEALAALPEAALRRAAAMVGRGEVDVASMAALLHAARAANPALDEAGFTRALVAAVETGRAATQIRAADLARRRAAVLEAAPEGARAMLERLPAEAMEQLQRQLERGGAGNPQQREAMFRALRSEVPEASRAAFEATLDALAGHAQARTEAARATRRAARLERLGDLPEALRGPLSALPDHALLALQAAHAQGETLTPARRARLLDDAARETPGLDKPALAAAIDAALALPREPTDQTARLRAQLEAAVPPDRRHLLADAAVLVMDDAAFARFARSAKGDAVTLMIDGRPTVVMRRGADPHVLQEEGLHVLQAREPATAGHAAQLDERTLADWDRLPVERQMELYRAKVALEIDGQQRLLASLDERARSASPDEAAALGGQRRLAEESLTNLRRRQAEVAGISALRQAEIGAGLADRPDWLDQPARLFSKRTAPTPAHASLGPDFTVGDKAMEAELRRQLAAVEAEGGDPADHVARLQRLGQAIADPKLASRAVATLRDATAAELPAAIAILHELAALPGGAGRDALAFALEPRGRAADRRQAAGALLATFDVAALPGGERAAALRLIETARDEQGSRVPLAAALASVREAFGIGALRMADPVLARVAIDALNLTQRGALDTHLGGVKRLLGLRDNDLVGAVAVGHLLAASSAMDQPGQFLNKVAGLAERVATAGDAVLAGRFRQYVELAASEQAKVTIPGTTRQVATEDLRAALQTMGKASALDAATRTAIASFALVGPRAVEQRLEAARAAFVAQGGNPATASDAYHLAAEMVALRPGSEAEAMLLAQTYGPAIEHLARRMSGDPFYGVLDATDLVGSLLRHTTGLTGEPLVDAVRHALRQRQMDYVLDRATLPEQLRALRGMEGAETGFLATDRWGKGKLFELYAYMRAGGDFVGLMGEPGAFVRQHQQTLFNSVDGFGPATSQIVRLAGDPSRSGDGVLSFSGDVAAPATMLPGRDYLIDTKAGPGAFKEDQFTRYVAEQLRGGATAPVAMTADGHAGLIYISDNEANAREASARAVAQLRLALNAAPGAVPTMQVGAPPHPLSAADLPRLRIFFATWGSDGKLRFISVDWTVAGKP